MLGSIDWAGFSSMIIAFGIAIPAVVAAVYSISTHKQIASPNGKSTGETVADTNSALASLSAEVTSHHTEKIPPAHQGKK